MTQPQTKNAPAAVVSTDHGEPPPLSGPPPGTVRESGPVEVLRRPQDARAATSTKPAANANGGKTPSDTQAAASSKTSAKANGGTGTKAPHPTATDAPAPASLSRGDLDLRAMLNQKEAELLALRGELNARDRLLLELNESSLATERARLELCEQLEELTVQLTDAQNEIRTQEAAKKLASRRTNDLKAAFRRSEADWKKKAEADLDALRAEHATELEEQAAAHASKLEELERSHEVALVRLQAQHAVADEQAEEAHSEALRTAEEAANLALSKLRAAHKQEVRTLQEAQEKALARAAESHAATLEATVAEAAADKANALSEAENLHRATQGELAAAQATVKYLERSQTHQATVIARHESKISALQESLHKATERADAGADTLTKLRLTLGSGLRLLDASPLLPKDEASDAAKESSGG